MTSIETDVFKTAKSAMDECEKVLELCKEALDKASTAGSEAINLKTELQSRLEALDK